MPRVKLIYIGDDEWVPPTAKWGECDHPRGKLRWDPRYGVPTYLYCMACGEAYIHPHHGLTEAQITEAHERGRQLMDKLLPPIKLPLVILCEGRLALLEEHGITWWRRWSNIWVPIESPLGGETPELPKRSTSQCRNGSVEETWSWRWSAFVSRSRPGYDSQFTIWQWVHAPLYEVKEEPVTRDAL